MNHKARIEKLEKELILTQQRLAVAIHLNDELLNRYNPKLKELMLKVAL